MDALVFPNSAYPDEMKYNAAFHLGLHCVPKWMYSVMILYIKRLTYISLQCKINTKKNEIHQITILLLEELTKTTDNFITGTIIKFNVLD